MSLTKNIIKSTEKYTGKHLPELNAHLKQKYETLFIKESALTARLGKTVYIRKEFHERIQKIVQVIGKNNLSLFSYIDNVLAHHFETFQNDITEAYNQKREDIF